MAPPERKGPTLSAGLLRHLGVDAQDERNGGRRNGVQFRRERRKESRAGRQPPKSRPAVKSQPRPAQPNRPDRRVGSGAAIKEKANGKPQPSRRRRGQDEDDEEEEEKDSSNEDDDDDDDGDDGDEAFDGFDTSDDDVDESDGGEAAAAPAAHLSMRVREKLQKDDAEIAELERKLGIKGRKTLPKAFNDDGLGELLDVLGGGGEHEDAETVEKRKRKAEADAWLRSKRRKAVPAKEEEQEQEEMSDDDDDDDDDDDGFEGSGDDSDVSDNVRERKQPPPPKRQRENPYVAPVVASAGKYVPPALRQAQQAAGGSDAEALARVRRQAHHLLARLSDANMLTILSEVEKLYADHPRQHVTDAVVDKLLEQVQIEGALSKSVIILIAGFSTAIYMVKGTDFGARLIQQNATLFKQHYDALVAAQTDGATTDAAAATAAAAAARSQSRSWAPSSKVALNLFALMAELYNFRMIGPNLIYDYIRLLLLGRLTELNTELLLRVLETSGHRLRQDDPRALKDIVALVQPAVVRAGGEKSLSARMRHMIDRINALKKGDKKKPRDADGGGGGGGAGYEYAERMRKVLGNLPVSRKLEASGPLRVGLADIEQADKRGKWWLVGASWAGRSEADNAAGEGDGGDDEEVAAVEGSSSTMASKNNNHRHQAPTDREGYKDNDDDDEDDVLGSWKDDIPDVAELDLLAREQGMNTDARRSIFVTLLSAADSRDAHARLLRLSLNKHEKREIANVLVRCVGAEQTYNRYYALVARQVCSADRRMSWVFQASLWRLFRRLGEPMFGELPDDADGNDDDDDDDDNDADKDEATNLRRVVNTAKLYGYLVACGNLRLDILKCLSLVRLQAKTRTFVEVLLLTLFEEARKAGQASGSGSGKNKSSPSTNIIRKRFGAVGNGKDDAAAGAALRRGLQYFLDKVVRRSKLVEGDAQAASVAKACRRAQKALRGVDGERA
ncbi:nuclear protein [Niveomyces insectorum RCEF 264]|uniref:Nuclear protein n=1 Tax=Niveomyces insectorum RCEF 264 TaxID=1081102 RepID=A0A167ML80_9HYPO|nr:nuclear protein [Niveomyces insectorum RCEF 264]